MKAKLVLSFVTWTTGEQRRNRENGWRFCTLEKYMSRAEAERADKNLKPEDPIHLADISFVLVSSPTIVGQTKTYVFVPSPASQAFKVPKVDRLVPVLPLAGMEFAEFLRRLRKVGYTKLGISNVLDGKPVPYRPDH